MWLNGLADLTPCLTWCDKPYVWLLRTGRLHDTA